MAAGRRAKSLTDCIGGKRQARPVAAPLAMDDGFVGERVTIDCEDTSTLKRVGIVLAGVTLVVATGGIFVL